MEKSSHIVDEAARSMLVEPACRGLFVDVKGPSDGLPVLVTCCESTEMDAPVAQVVTDMVFADAGLAKELRVQRFDDLLEELVERAVDEGRALVTWGPGLVDATERHTDLGRRLARVISDVRPALLGADRDPQTRARKRREPDLADLLCRVGLPPPRHLHSKQSAQRLRYVRQQLIRHDAFESITSTAKAKWTKLLQQGEHDCRGLQRLLLTVTASAT